MSTKKTKHSLQREWFKFPALVLAKRPLLPYSVIPASVRHIALTAMDDQAQDNVVIVDWLCHSLHQYSYVIRTYIWVGDRIW